MGYIDFQKFSSLRWFFAGFVYSVYISFRTLIVDIEVALSILVIWCCLQCFIDFQRFTSFRCFGAGYVFNVYVGFDTHIVEIWVWWSCLSSIFTSVFAYLFAVVPCLQCLHLFSHTYSNLSMTSLWLACDLFPKVQQIEMF